jgi:exonuclease-1
MLLHFGIIPYLVFDGDYLPSKAATEDDRAKRRAAARASGLEMLNAGRVAQANLELRKAVDVTPEMARLLMEELKKAGVQYVVAPYEADAQMVYLERQNIVSAIISEDSDLLVFGAKCLLTKLDEYGNCVEIDQADFCACKEISLAGWTEREFRQMAILSGCDYLASINNMGLKTAHRMIRKYKTVEKVIRMLEFDGKFQVPKGYLEQFYQAEQTFLHQRVFCPINKELVYHTQPEQPLDEEKVTYIGKHLASEIAIKVARGDLNPITKEPIVMDKENPIPSRTPRTPWTSAKPALRNAVSTSDLKKGVTLEQFFKPKRTPLAELDVNCFTPSPSQQQALARNSGPWLATPAPRPYLNRAATVSEPELPEPYSAPQRQAGRQLSGSNFLTEPRPQKRARLCADDDTAGPCTAQPALGRSRYFAVSADQSPSLSRLNDKRNSSKADDIEIYSDDSFEEAMSHVADVNGPTPASARSISVYADKDNNDDAAPGVEDVPGLTQGASFASNAEDSQSTITSITASFSYTSSTKKQNTSVAQQTVASKIPMPSRPSPSLPTSAKFQGLPNLGRSLSTPLQSLGARAMNRNNNRATALPTPPYTPNDTPCETRTTATFTRHSKPKPAGLGGLPFPEAARPGMVVKNESSLKQVVRPEDIPLPAMNVAEKLALANEKAQEKYDTRTVVADSEVESDDEVLSPVAKKADLGRFAFKG